MNLLKEHPTLDNWGCKDQKLRSAASINIIRFTMERRWSSKYEKCQECGTQRYHHRAKGLCTRCYQLVQKLKQIDQWDFADPKTLKEVPLNIRYLLDEKTFNRMKRGAAEEVRWLLNYLKLREQTLQGPITGLDVEYSLRHIARLCGVRNKNLFFGIASSIDSDFNMKQKKVLYELLNTIEEDLPWRAKQ
jgi:hypothetical protein